MIENVLNHKYTVHDLVRGRCSPRAFSNRTVEHDKLLVEIAIQTVHEEFRGSL